MNLKTITYDADTWQLVPKEATPEMLEAIRPNQDASLKTRFLRMLFIAPQPETVSPWLPIETAPKDGSNFYVTGFNYGSASNGRWNDVGHVTPRGGIKSTLTWLNLDFATHWMPLPVFDGGQ